MKNYARFYAVLTVAGSVACTQPVEGSRQPQRLRPLEIANAVSCDSLLQAMSAVYEVPGMPPDKWIEVFASDYWPAPERIPFVIDGFELDQRNCENARFFRVQMAQGPHVLRVRARQKYIQMRVVLVSPPSGVSLFSPEVCLLRSEPSNGFSWVGCDRFPLPDGGSPN